MSLLNDVEIPDWLDDTALNEEDSDLQIDEYDLASSPNDFNVLTIFSFIESGAVKVPGFQRHYVWDLKRASKLVESLIIGLPIPQIFLYEEGRNNFLVIDGQQRLMTIFYFIKQRFPRRDKRAELRTLVESGTTLSDELMFNDEYFEDFRLRLPNISKEVKNKFHRLRYTTLGEYKTQFDLRTIRNIIVKQVSPRDDDSSIYEMFNRLNTGGVNLTPQEIRGSLHHSDFMDLLARLNLDERWRRLIGSSTPDLHMRDVEILLRAEAMWHQGDTYKASMVSFLNRFAKSAKAMTPSDLSALESDFDWFLDALTGVDRSVFLSRQGKLMIPVFEAVFAGSRVLRDAGARSIPAKAVTDLRADVEFAGLASAKTADTSNVTERIRIARRVLSDHVSAQPET
jgi:Protein of unknown function DUF262